VLCVDGTFLSGKYHASLLTAIAADANNQILPVAFAYVESENNDSLAMLPYLASYSCC
jgi:hypothetical protein